MNPTKIIKYLLPSKLKWIKEIVDVEHSGTVRSYRGSGYLSNPDDVWEEYEITIEVDYSLLEYAGKCFLPSKNIITNRGYLDLMIGYAEFICLSDVLYEINQLTSSNNKYKVVILNSDDSNERPF